MSGTASDEQARLELGLERSRYEGPTGIVGVFQDAATSAGLRSISFWAAVPHYVASPPCPKATLALLRKVEDLLDLPVPLGELPEQARTWERSVDEMTAEDSDVAEYVASLEQREPEVDLPEASGDAIAKEFERYLRRGGDADASGLQQRRVGAEPVDRPLQPLLVADLRLPAELGLRDGDVRLADRGVVGRPR